MNAFNTILGWSDDPPPGTYRHLVTWNNSALTEFFVPDADPTPTRINDNDQVLTVQTYQGVTVSVGVWLKVEGFAMRFLPDFPNLDNNVATAINDAGTLVGYVFDHQGNSRALVCLHQFESLDLNSLIPAADQKHWLLQSAQGVNDRGQIVGVGTFDGASSLFLLTPSQPLPSQSCFSAPS